MAASRVSIGCPGVEAEGRCGGLRSIAETLPDLALRVPAAAEDQRFAPGTGRPQDQSRAGLGKAGQIPEGAVEPIRELRVAVAQPLGRGEVHRDPAAARCHRIHDPGAAGTEHVCVHHDSAAALGYVAFYERTCTLLARNSASARASSSVVPTLYQRPR